MSKTIDFKNHKWTHKRKWQWRKSKDSANAFECQNQNARNFKKTFKEWILNGLLKNN